MNTVVTSKEEILQTSRELMQQQGWSAITIRSVAAGCKVSVGSIYNYFDSKEQLIEATVESVWCEIFHRPKEAAPFEDTQACLTWIYRQIEYGCQRYPGFFVLHSMSFLPQNKSDGKRRMHQIWQHIADELCAVLHRDPRIRPDAFTEQLTAEDFANILFSLLLAAFLRQDYDPSAVLEIVHRTLY